MYSLSLLVTLASSFKLVKLTATPSTSVVSQCLSSSSSFSSTSSAICNLHPNLSLTPDLISLLDKGLKFIPTPHSDIPISHFKQNLTEFCRKIQWSSFYNFESGHTITPFTTSTGKFPPASKISHSTHQLCNNLGTLLNDTHQTQHIHKLPSNLTQAEKRALKQLKCDNTVILKPADKGGKLVLQHRDNYKLEALRQLNDNKFYKPLSSPIYLQTATLIKRTVNNMRHQGFINKRQQQYLLPPNKPRPRHFYTLPKIHKPADKWTVPGVIPPGRPIVSGCNSESAAIEHFIDYHLQPIATSIPSFIRDSLHFKSLLSDIDIKQSDILFTLDVESLYTNIPIEEGIACVKKALSEHTSTTTKNRPDKFLLILLQLTLLRNDFQFNEQTFLQIKGTAMGKKYAPAFANIFMHYWEQQALSSTNYTPLFWKRYIDDIFGIWPHSEDRLHNFVQHLNSINPNIKVTISYNLHTVHFLDCNVYKNSCKLATKVYFKPTDTHKLLHPKSYHPAHVFKGIVKAQLLRFIRLSSHFQDFLQSYRILKSALLKYGYTRSFLKNCKQSALSLTNCHYNSMITGCQPCHSKQCLMCFYTRSTAIISSNLHNHTFPITQNTSCNTRNCIYTLHCTMCTHIPTIYVGETKNCIRARFSQHKHNILTHNKDTVVSKHFNQPDHNLSMLRISIVQFFTQHHKNPCQIDDLRKKCELLWIKKLHTYTPIGLNTVTHLKTTNIPLILKYSNSACQLMRQVKNTLSNDTMYPNNNKFSVTTSFTNHKNLQKILAPTKF